MGLDFAELRNGNFFAPDGDIIDDPDELSWIIVYGCKAVATFAFEPCDDEELFSVLSLWRSKGCMGDRKVSYGLFRYGRAYRVAPLYEVFSMGLIGEFDDVKNTEDLFNALCVSEEAEDRGLVGVL